MKQIFTALIILSSSLLCLESRAAHQRKFTVYDALRKCAYMESLSPADFQRVADQSGTTVGSLERDCTHLEQMSRANHAPVRSSPQNSRQRRSTPRSEPAICDCGPFQTCVEQNTQWICVEKHSNDNHCSNVMDCKSSMARCEDNHCI